MLKARKKANQPKFSNTRWGQAAAKVLAYVVKPLRILVIALRWQPLTLLFRCSAQKKEKKLSGWDALLLGDHSALQQKDEGEEVSLSRHVQRLASLLTVVNGNGLCCAGHRRGCPRPCPCCRLREEGIGCVHGMAIFTSFHSFCVCAFGIEGLERHLADCGGRLCCSVTHKGRDGLP